MKKSHSLPSFPGHMKAGVDSVFINWVYTEMKTYAVHRSQICTLPCDPQTSVKRRKFLKPKLF